MFKRIFAVVCVLAIAMAVFAGCGSEAEDQDNDQGTQVDETKDKVIMVTDTGGINDKSFNQSAWEGLQSIADEYPNTEFDYILSQSEVDYEANLRDAVSQGSDITWGIGYMLADALKNAATDLPDAKFGLVDFVHEEPLDNVVYVVFKEEEGSFLVGVIAGMVTESNKVGFVGGMEGDLIKKFENGFKAGVKAVNPDCEVIVAYAQSWSDTEKGYNLATAMYEQGADIIYHAAGGVGVGVFNAAKAKGTGPEGYWTIGVDRDQYDEAPDNMLTSMVKRVGSAMVQVVRDYLDNDEFPGGQVLSFGLAEDGVGIAPTTEQTLPEDIKDEVLAKVEEFKQKIINGEITIPKTDEEFANWSLEK